MNKIGSSTDPYCSADQLITILRQRGLLIENEQQAKFFLLTVGHHRLGPYYRVYSHEDKTFHDGVYFSNVHGLYALERRLRLLLLGPLEKLEVSIRSLIIAAMGASIADDGSPHNVELFDKRFYNLSTDEKKNHHTGIMRSAARETERKQKYLMQARTREGLSGMAGAAKKLEQLPAWFIIQCLTFGDLSRMFYILDPNIAKQVASFFEMPVSIMRNALHSLTQLRNACAHHDTVLGARFRTMKFPQRYKDDACVKGTGDVYESCAMLHILLGTLSERSTWYRRLKKLLNEYDCVDITRMGFPDNWQTMPFWCVHDVRRIEEVKLLRSRSNLVSSHQHQAAT